MPVQVRCTILASNLAFLMIYSAYKLNKQGDNIRPWRTPFPTWNKSVVPCPVLTVASWPAYRFFRRQVRWSRIPISWRIFQFVVIHTVKGFSIVNEAEVEVFWELPCSFYNPTNVGNLISGWVTLRMGPGTAPAGPRGHSPTWVLAGGMWVLLSSIPLG